MVRKEILQKSAEVALQKVIAAKRGPANADVFFNLEYLCEEIEKFGKKSCFIPLKYKKLLCTMLDADYRIEFHVNKTEEYCEVEAKLYWSDMEIPAGIGFVRKHYQEIAPMDCLTKEERLSLLETTCRGAASTRAISDAGIGTQFYGDVEDMLFDKQEEHEAEKSLDKAIADKVPVIESKEEKKAKRAAKKAKSAEDSASSPTTIVEVAEIEELPTIQQMEEKNAKVEEFLNLVAQDDVAEVPMESETAKMYQSEISLEDALNAVADIGNCAGNTLKSIYEANPKQLIWLANRSAQVAEHAKVIIYSDSDLVEKYERHAK